MDRKYEVDDILAELRQKRQQRGGTAAPSQRQPAQQPASLHTPAQSAPPAPVKDEGFTPASRDYSEDAPPAKSRWGMQAEDEDDTPRASFAIKQPVMEERYEAPPAPPAKPEPLGFGDYDHQPQRPVRETPPASAPKAAPVAERFLRSSIQDDGIPAESENKDNGRIRGGFAEKWRAGMEGFGQAEDEPPSRFSRRSQRQQPAAKVTRQSYDEPDSEQAEELAPSLSFGNNLPEEDHMDMDATRLNLPLAGTAASSHHPARAGAAFAMEDEDDDWDDEEEALGEDEEIFEYTTPAQTPEVWSELRSLRSGLLVRLLVTGICSLVLIYFAFSYTYPLPLPTFMQPERDLGMFFIANLVVLVIGVMLCSNTMGGGLISLFTLKADNDSLASAAVLACLIQGAALIVSPQSYEGPGVHLYLPLAALTLFFNSFGKLLIVARLSRGFQLLSRSSTYHTASLITEKDLAHELTRGQNLDHPQVVFSTKAGFLTNYLELSHGEDYSDSVARILAPVCLGAGLVMSLVSLIFNKDIFVALTVLAAVLCIASPFTALFVGNLPMAGMSRRLSKHGAMVSGYSAIDRFGEANSVVLGCSDLFPAGSITLHGIKLFQKNRIDEAILDAASVICSCDSTLTGIFTEMIGGRTELLKKVESLTYEDGLGLSAWVDGKRVLIGNRDLMKHHGIDIPSRDYEQRYVQDDRELLYLSNSGELTAMYVLDYGCNPEVDQEMGRLIDRDMTLVVYSTDPYVTPDRLDKIFGYPAELIRIMPAKAHAQYNRASAAKESCRAYLAHDGSLSSFVHALLEIQLTRGAVMMGTILQMSAIVLGFALITFAAFMQSTSALSWTALLGYQLFWSLAILTFPNLRRI